MLRDNVSLSKPPEAGFKRGHCEGNIVGVHVVVELEPIYIGRRFKNDTERPERLFEIYTKMTKDKNLRAV
ncbi:MAG: hypothetical protein ING09_07445 [Roseomonas sp.]|nr:hypothetical protein [Roseomonas sp.]MCA3291276.1 hypothetical protein [Roseomonas sp.]MCA3295852.1 hypothetical protein [Roseomonas sp.]